MNLVLGLSLTSATVRWVLVEGTTGEGAPIDRGSLDIPAIDSMDADLLLDAVLTPAVLAEGHLHAVGVTCTGEAMPAAAAVLDALAARGQGNVGAVSASDAAMALASGVADITDYDDVAVCIVEPDAAYVALVAHGRVTVDHVDRPLDGADALELTSSVIAALDLKDRAPNAIFVVGSDDVDVIVSSFAAISDVPVFSADEADLALARGAALAAARAVGVGHSPWAELTARLTSRTGVLSLVLGAAVVTFVVSLSMALGLSLMPETSGARPENANAAGAPAPAAGSPAVLEAAPTPTVGQSPFSGAPKLAMTMVAAAPPVAAPVDAPPPVYQPPVPAYVPPPPYQQPRLRDRILERIPIINRFHDPQG